MLIQCIIEREGITTVTYQGKAYEFKPEPELTGNDTDMVCEVVPSHGQSHFLSMGGFKEWQPSGKHHEKPKAKPEPPKEHDVLTKDLFASTTNAPTLKSYIKKCGNAELLNELGEIEDSSLSKRPWVVEAINSRLDELEGK